MIDIAMLRAMAADLNDKNATERNYTKRVRDARETTLALRDALELASGPEADAIRSVVAAIHAALVLP